MPPCTTTITTTVEEETSKELTHGPDKQMHSNQKQKSVHNDQQQTSTALKGYKCIFGEYQTNIIWFNAIAITIFHIFAIYAFVSFPYFYKIRLIIWGFVMGGIAGFGVTGGAHRLWTHRTYKAKLPLQIILIICYSAAGQNTIFDWVRDHRVHHKYSETDADPHNSNRGFFFSHMGWLYMRKHPEVLSKGKQIDMSDILDDPLIKFHHKYFSIFKLLFCFLLPTLLPVYLWNESAWYTFTSQCLGRYVISLHCTWLVNSVAHLYGNKPYDITINPRENLFVSVMAMGEGWHNYHHTFPWDYKASEFGKLNTTLILLNFFAKIGWAYDLKSPSKELVQKVIDKRGESCIHQNGHHHHHHMHKEVPESEDIYKIS